MPRIPYEHASLFSDVKASIEDQQAAHNTRRVEDVLRQTAQTFPPSDAEILAAIQIVSDADAIHPPPSPWQRDTQATDDDRPVTMGEIAALVAQSVTDALNARQGLDTTYAPRPWTDREVR